MLYDNPRIMYENPSPPSEDFKYVDENPSPPSEDFKYVDEPIFFTIPRPRSVQGVKTIKIDPSLIYLSFYGFNEKDEKRSLIACLEKKRKRSFTETACLEKNEKRSFTETACLEKKEKRSFTETACLKKIKKQYFTETVCLEKNKKQNFTETTKRYENIKYSKNIESIKAETGLNILENSLEKIHRMKLEKELVAIPENISCVSSDYYCNVCKLNMNSLIVYSAHMKGKRHKKAIRHLAERQLHKSPVLETIDPQNLPRQTEIVRVQLHCEKSRIQKICDDADLPILGLNNVKEIRGSEIKYHCDLCSIQCIENVIIDHLVGAKHQMNCLKKYCPKSYSWIKHHGRNDRRVEKELKLRLKEIRMNHGVGKIRVFKEVEKNPVCPELYDPHQPSTSKHGLDVPEQNAQNVSRPNGLRVTDEECLSRDYSDFYCKVCDSHMNTHATWENHVIGKRHAKNKRKSSKDSGTANNFAEALHGTTSHLEQLIADQCDTNAIIVGLNFIQEYHGEIGDQYNCFLCSCVSPRAEIINHLNLTKHKQKYLEKMFVDGHYNAINKIKSLHIGQLSKEALIDSECVAVWKIFGSGKPIIYEQKVC